MGTHTQCVHTRRRIILQTPVHDGTRMQARTVEWAAGHGLSLLPAPEHASPTVSCIRAGELDVGDLVGGLAERGYAISNGYGDLKG